MTISNAAKPLGTPQLGKAQPIVDPATGRPTDYMLGYAQAHRRQWLAASRNIPCEATGTNVITLTPLHPVSPLIDAYRVFDRFTFVAEHTSTGAVTATVVPERGVLTTL